jgi:hypothetical protein
MSPMRATALDGSRAFTWPCEVPMVTIWVVPRYSTPKTWPHLSGVRSLSAIRRSAAPRAPGCDRPSACYGGLEAGWTRPGPAAMPADRESAIKSDVSHIGLLLCGWSPRSSGTQASFPARAQSLSIARPAARDLLARRVRSRLFTGIYATSLGPARGGT